MKVDQTFAKEIAKLPIDKIGPAVNECASRRVAE
jgi:hypothetical protein